MKKIFILSTILLTFSINSVYCQNSESADLMPPEVPAEIEAKMLKDREKLKKKELKSFRKKYHIRIDEIIDSSTHNWIVAKDNKQGVINTRNKKLVLPIKYEFVKHLLKKVFIVYENRGWGLFSYSGEELIPSKPTQQITPTNDTANAPLVIISDSTILTKDGYSSQKIGSLYNIYGKLIAPNIYSSIKYISDKYLLTEKNSFKGIIDSSGKIVFDNQFIDIDFRAFYKVPHLVDTLFIAKRNDGKYGIISLSGNILLPFEYEYITYSGCNRILVQKGKMTTPNLKCGYLDLNLNLIIPFSSDRDITDCSEDMIREGCCGLYGYMDTLGNRKIPLEYSEVRNFEKGMAVVKKNNKFGVIDKSNNVLLPFIYDGCGQIGGFIHLRIGKKCGVLDFNLKTILPIEFDYVRSMTGFDGIRFFGAELDGKCIKYNLLGQKIDGECD